MGSVHNPTATTQQQPLAYLTYLNFGENVATLLLQLLALPLDINLLVTSVFYPKKLTVSSQNPIVAEHGGLSKSMVALISTHLISSILVLPYGLYVAFTWRMSDAQARSVAIFDPSLLFWLGISGNLTIVVPSIAVFFLTLDRLLVLTCGPAYGRREKNLFLYAELTVLVTVAVSLIGLTISFEWPLQWNEGKYISLLFLYYFSYFKSLWLVIWI